MSVTFEVESSVGGYSNAPPKIGVKKPAAIKEKEHIVGGRACAGAGPRVLKLILKFTPVETVIAIR